MKSFLKRSEPDKATLKIASGRELARHVLEQASITLYSEHEAARAIGAGLAHIPCAVEADALAEKSSLVAHIRRAVALRSPVIWLVTNAAFADLQLPAHSYCLVYNAATVQQFSDALLLALALQSGQRMPVILVASSGHLYDAPASIDLPDKKSIESILKQKNGDAPLQLNRARAIGLENDNLREMRTNIAREAMLYDNLNDQINEAVALVKKETGRTLENISEYGKGAAVLLAANSLQPQMSQPKKSRIVHLQQWYPFPAEELKAKLASAKKIAVLEEAGNNRFQEKCATLLPKSDKVVRASGWYLEALLSEGHTTALLDKLNTLQPPADYHFYLTPHSEEDLRLYPLAEAANQWLQRHYPQAVQRLLPAKEISAETDDFLYIECYLPAYLQWQKALALLTESLSGLPGCRVSSVLQQHPEAMLPAIHFRIAVTGTPEPWESGRVVLCHGSALAQMVGPRNNDVLWLFSGDFNDKDLWHLLNDKQRRHLKEKKIPLLRADAIKLLSGKMVPGQRPYMEPLLPIAAWLQHSGWLNADPEHVPHLARAVNKHYGGRRKEVFALLRDTEQALNKTNVASLPDFQRLQRDENNAPWNFFANDTDQAGFWDNEGFFYKNGISEIISPAESDTTHQLASGSAAIRDYFDGRRNYPQLIPENCTVCGQCWTRCPDAALPAALFSVDELLDTLFENAAGHSFLHLPRIKKQWAQVIRKELKNDGLHKYRNSGLLLKETFAILLEKLQVDDEKTRAMREEFTILSMGWLDMPLVKNERWFDEAESREKSSGKLLTINLNPAACKECLACIDACPDNALESVPQKENHRLQLQQRFNNTLKLTPSSTEQEGLLSLLQPESYFRISGGDNALPGSGTKTAVRLLLAAMSQKGEEKKQRLLKQTEDLLARLDEAIRGDVQQTMQLNELDQFARRLSEVKAGELNSEKLRELADNPKPDEQRLKAFAGLRGELNHWRLALSGNDENGERIAPFTMCVAAGPALHWVTRYPHNPFNVPWLLAADDPATEALGLLDATKQNMGKLFELIARVEATLEDHTDIDEAAALPYARWSDEQKALCPDVLLLAERATLKKFDFSAFAGFMNNTPQLAFAVVDDMADNSADTVTAWALQSDTGLVHGCAARPEHLLDAIINMPQQQLRVIRIYAAEPLQMGLPSYAARRIEEKAIHGRVFPLLSYHNGELDLSANPQPENDFEITDKRVNGSGEWALYHFGPQHFRAPTAADSAGMTPLEDVISRPQDKRKGLIPTVTVVEDGKPQTWVVDNTVRAFAEAALLRWRVWQQMAGIRDRRLDYWQEKWQSEKEKVLAEQKQELDAAWQEKFNALDNEHFSVYHKRLSERLKQLYSAQGGGAAQQSLAEWLQQAAKNGNKND